MKLVCPKCLSHLKVPASRVPSGGGWARCPKCAERFFVKSPGQGLDLLSEASAGSAPRRLRRDQESQHMLDRLRAARGDEAWGSHNEDLGAEIPMVTIFPEPALSPAVGQAIGIALLCLPVLVLTMIFFSSKPPQPPPVSTAVFEEKFNDEMNVELVRADLVAIRKKMMRQQRVIYAVDFTGSESRIFKYFVHRLAPGRCDSFTRLDLESDKPIKGYLVTAACVEGSLKELKMEVTWTDRTARVHFPDYPEYEDDELDMFPFMTMTARKKK